MLLFLNKADFLEIYLKTFNPFFNILERGRLATCRRNLWKSVRRFYSDNELFAYNFLSFSELTQKSYNQLKL